MSSTSTKPDPSKSPRQAKSSTSASLIPTPICLSAALKSAASTTPPRRPPTKRRRRKRLDAAEGPHLFNAARKRSMVAIERGAMCKDLWTSDRLFASLGNLLLGAMSRSKLPCPDVEITRSFLTFSFPTGGGFICWGAGAKATSLALVNALFAFACCSTPACNAVPLSNGIRHNRHRSLAKLSSVPVQRQDSEPWPAAKSSTEI
mmetsp:Transcript_59267/g.94052  ORF Transcript_59267/g.94052 Transcript_59267/m.94052 type:complete len:204 (+) Transcript_59267:769-1380(+)